MVRVLFVAILLLIAVAPLDAAGGPRDYFGVRVVDADTGRGVPLVELRTTYKTAYYTDSNGYVAFNEPGLMGHNVWFDVQSWGYKSPEGSFGTRGVQLRTTPGTVAEIRLDRAQIAERLYRLTGYGVYRDTELLGRPVPLKQPLLNARVTGSDTVQTAVYRGKMRWFWQDTNRADFALGNFSMTGATSDLPARLDVVTGIRFDYFAGNDGFARPMAAIAQPGEVRPIWVDGLMVVADAGGRERLVARWVAAAPDLRVARAGLALYDDARELFIEYKPIPDPAATHLVPSGHPFRATVGGRDYFYVSNPFPTVRVPADFESAGDPAAYEGFTCFKSGGRDDVDRDAAGTLVWTWRRGVEPVTAEELKRLIEAKKITADESPFALRDIDTGKAVEPAAGSIAWNPHLKRWLFLFGQKLGDSVVGEIWLAAADAPEGPWRDARKVATHALPGRNMDLYNPMQHPELARENGRFTYFEGTFVNTFSGSPTPVPLYDYNQLLYRVDLDDPRLTLLVSPSAPSASSPQ